MSTLWEQGTCLANLTLYPQCLEQSLVFLKKKKKGSKLVNEQQFWFLVYDMNRVIQKTKVTVSGPITSWQIYGGKVEAVTDFIFLASKITVDSDCSHEDACSLEEKQWQTSSAY